MNQKKMQLILNEVMDELTQTMKYDAPMSSPHDGYGKVLEELDEACWKEHYLKELENKKDGVTI